MFILSNKMSKIEFDDFPRWLNPKLSHKEIKKCYEDEIKKIDNMARRRKSPNKVPWYPWAYYCVAHIDHTKYQWWNNFILIDENE